MTRTIILSAIVAATLMTGLLVGSFPTTFAGVGAPCPPVGTFVTIVGSDGSVMTYPIDSYTFSTKSDKKKDKNMFMFSHEPDDDEGDTGIGLSAKILAAIKSGDTVDIHFTACKELPRSTPDNPIHKKHEVWLTGATITETSETPGDDGFPTEKATGKFKDVTRMTSTTGTPSD